jgi:hypothetical protein
MIEPEDPPGFVVRTEARKAAANNGFRLERGIEGGWLHFGSTTAQGEIWIAGVSPNGPWLLSVSRPEIAAEIGVAPVPAEPGPGAAAFMFASLGHLYAALDRTYRLGISLPDAPLASFRAATKELPRTTEAERLIIQRVGQDVFRKALIAYWGGKCPLTGITDPALLRATSCPGPNVRRTSTGSMSITACSCRRFGTLLSMPASSVLPKTGSL